MKKRLKTTSGFMVATMAAIMVLAFAACGGDGGPGGGGAPALVSIAVPSGALPAIKSDGTLDLSGLEITSTFSDASTSKITFPGGTKLTYSEWAGHDGLYTLTHTVSGITVTIDGFNPDNLGPQTLTVTVGGFTANLNVIVSGPSLAALNAAIITAETLLGTVTPNDTATSESEVAFGVVYASSAAISAYSDAIDTAKNFVSNANSETSQTAIDDKKTALATATSDFEGVIKIGAKVSKEALGEAIDAAQTALDAWGQVGFDNDTPNGTHYIKIEDKGAYQGAIDAASVVYNSNPDSTAITNALNALTTATTAFTAAKAQIYSVDYSGLGSYITAINELLISVTPPIDDPDSPGDAADPADVDAGVKYVGTDDYVWLEGGIAYYSAVYNDKVNVSQKDVTDAVNEISDFITLFTNNFIHIGTKPLPVALSAGTWVNNTLATGKSYAYTINAQAGTTYYIQWDDTDYSSKSADIIVSAKDAAGDDLFSDPSWGGNDPYYAGYADVASPYAVKVSSNQIITLTVKGIQSDSYGNYAIRYYTTDSPTTTPVFVSNTVTKSDTGDSYVEFPLSISGYASDFVSVQVYGSANATALSATVGGYYYSSSPIDSIIGLYDNNSPLAPGTYYITVTEGGKTASSPRVALTVVEYDPLLTPTPEFASTTVVKEYHDSSSAAFQTFTEYSGSAVVTVYTGATGDTTSAVTGGYYPVYHQIILSTGSADITLPAATYYITVTDTGNGKTTASERVALTVVEAGTVLKTPTPQFYSSTYTKYDEEEDYARFYLSGELYTNGFTQVAVYGPGNANTLSNTVEGEYWYYSPNEQRIDLFTEGEPLPAGDYWITVTDRYKTVSDKVKVTVENPYVPPEGSGSLGAITYWTADDYDTTLESGLVHGVLTVSRGNKGYSPTVVISVPFGFTSDPEFPVTWLVKGSPVANGISYTFSSAGRSNGLYPVTVYAAKIINGIPVPYSAVINITVVD
jgi:hypothetical protein